MGARTALLVGLVSSEWALAQGPVVSYPRKHLVRGKGERTLHLMQKTQPGFGSRNWAFGGFDPVTAEPLKLELPGDCLLCHQAAVVSDMAFTTSGTVQYRYCPQPGRQICPF